MFGAAIVTESDLAPILTSVQENVAVILPVGLAILAILVGVSLIPKIIGAFIGKN